MPILRLPDGSTIEFSSVEELVAYQQGVAKNRPAPAQKVEQIKTAAQPEKPRSTISSKEGVQVIYRKAKYTEQEWEERLNAMMALAKAEPQSASNLCKKLHTSTSTIPRFLAYYEKKTGQPYDFRLMRKERGMDKNKSVTRSEAGRQAAAKNPFFKYRKEQMGYLMSTGMSAGAAMAYLASEWRKAKAERRALHNYKECPPEKMSVQITPSERPKKRPHLSMIENQDYAYEQLGKLAKGELKSVFSDDVDFQHGMGAWQVFLGQFLMKTKDVAAFLGVENKFHVEGFGIVYH